MQYVKCDIQTVCCGIAMSMGAFLLAGGTKGKRLATANSRIMIHQVSSGFQGQATDIEIQARETLSLRKKLDEMLAENCGQDYEKVAKDTERDYYMSSLEASDYGLIDRIVGKVEDADVDKAKG
jgi:ATP-dependent Clp protease protease subunit